MTLPGSAHAPGLVQQSLASLGYHALRSNLCLSGGAVKKGYTLIELSFVLAMIGVLSALAVPIYDSVLKRVRASEARANLPAIAHAEMQHYRDQGRYLDCPAFGPVPQGASTFPSGEACWKELGISISGEVRYRYGVIVEEQSFRVVAEGDLDRDGTASRFTFHGIDGSIEVERELE